MNADNPIVAQDERNAIALKIDMALFHGDVSKLSHEERTIHMRNVCESIGLNPLTQPIGYVTLPNGKMVPYVYKSGTDQLRKLHGVNIEIVNRSVQGELLTVHARATDKTGRRDEDFGVVSVAGLRGEAAANASLKCVTKAKRRVTLSICGLGWLDESEVDDIPGAVSEPFAHLENKPSSKPANAPDADYSSRVGDSETMAHTGPIVRIHDEQLAKRVADKVQDSIDTHTRFEDREKAEPTAIPLREETAAGWSAWATTLMAYIRAAPDLATLFQWKTLNEATLARLQERSKITHTKLIDQIDDNIAMRREQDDAQ